MISINNKQLEFKEGMTVAQALKLAGENIDHMVIVMVDKKIIPHRDLKFTTVADNSKISLLRLVSGG